MAPLRAVLVAVALASAAPATAGPLDRWQLHIGEAAARFGIPESWIRRVMRAESGGRTMLAGRPIESHAGAMGLMQIMPGTWRELRAAHGLGPDPHHPRDNILAGAAYLRAMYDRFGYPGLFAAYNAGPARYAEHLASGRRLPAETIAYVASVAGPSGMAVTQPRTRRPTTALFLALAQPAADERRTPGDGQMSGAAGIFVRLSTTPPPDAPSGPDEGRAHLEGE
jgi:soluble lytic murein transglycosylase-like protein